MGPGPHDGAVPTEVLVPIKAFARAKLRLAPRLGPVDRARLARAMAARVLAAAAPLPAIVVCDDRDVARFAAAHGARVEYTPNLGLNGAVAEAVRRARGRGVGRVVVSHADLPLAVELPAVADFEGVTLVPDRHRQGTNVASVPTSAPFEWSYGAGSFERHRAEAVRLGLPLRILDAPALAWDVDLPDDMELPPDADVGAEVAALLDGRPVP
jgi:2-phospho-L-lactate guanylyltransferase